MTIVAPRHLSATERTLAWAALERDRRAASGREAATQAAPGPVRAGGRQVWAWLGVVLGLVGFAAACFLAVVTLYVGASSCQAHENTGLTFPRTRVM